MHYEITDRKQAEAALREAERLQKAILDTMRDPVWLKDAEGRFLACNESLAKLYGVPVEAIVGRTVFDGAPSEAERFSREDQEVITSRRPLVTEAPMTDTQGQVRWFETIKAPLFDEQRQVIGTVGSSRETTDRKRSESLLLAQRDLGVGLSHSTDLQTALRHFLATAARIGGLDCGGVYLLRQADHQIELAAQIGLSPSFAKAVERFPADSPQVKLLLRGKPLFDTFANLHLPLTAIELREGLRAFAFIPLYDRRRIVGALNLASHTADAIPPEMRIAIEALAAQAAGAIVRIRAEAERHRLEHQLLEISDREHARIGQDIHDGLCQQLVSLAFDANLLRRELAAGGRPLAKTANRLANYLDQAISEARQLSRGLFPVRLEKEGLPSALEELARTTRDRFKLRCSFKSLGSD